MPMNERRICMSTNALLHSAQVKPWPADSPNNLNGPGQQAPNRVDWRFCTRARQKPWSQRRAAPELTHAAAGARRVTMGFGRASSHAGEAQQARHVGPKHDLDFAQIALRRALSSGSERLRVWNVLPVVLPLARRPRVADSVEPPGPIEAMAPVKRHVGSERLHGSLQVRELSLQHGNDLGRPGRPVDRFGVQAVKRLQQRCTKRSTSHRTAGPLFTPDREPVRDQRSEQGHRRRNQRHRDADFHAHLDNAPCERFAVRPCNRGRKT